MEELQVDTHENGRMQIVHGLNHIEGFVSVFTIEARERNRVFFNAVNVDHRDKNNKSGDGNKQATFSLKCEDVDILIKSLTEMKNISKTLEE